MILTGPQLIEEHAQGRLRIDPFDPAHVQPNGYDFHLHPELLRLGQALDARQAPEPDERLILDAPRGALLLPDQLYLGLTAQTFQTDHHAMWLFGDRSLGSLGVWVQVSAPLGHVGSKIRWTLELRVLRPVRLYAGMRMGKVCFLVNQGDIAPYGDARFIGGKYLRDQLQLSQLSTELEATAQQPIPPEVHDAADAVSDQ